MSTEVEQQIMAHLRAEQPAEAVALAVDSYGSALFGYLVSRLPRDLAEDGFQDLCEQLLLGAMGFEGRCSFRVWAFHLARGVRCKLLRDPSRRRSARLSTGHEAALVDRAARTLTASWRQTAALLQLREACAGLSAEDQALLLLRTAQRMSWLEIARVRSEHPEEPDGAELRRSAARLRKRYERIKRGLRESLASSG